MTKDGYAPGRECRVCGGRCCRERGCSLAPQDLERQLENSDNGDLREKILTLLEREDGLYAIDCFHGPEGPFYFLRMRHKCYTFIGVDAIGECVALTQRGCQLSFEERPKGGRFLESRPDFHCEQRYTKADMLTDWAPYQECFASIWQEYYERFMKDGTFDRCDERYFDYQRQRRKLRR